MPKFSLNIGKERDGIPIVAAVPYIEPFEIGTEADVLADTAAACLYTPTAVEQSPGVFANVIELPDGTVKSTFEADYALAAKIGVNWVEYGIGDNSVANKHLLRVGVGDKWATFKLDTGPLSVPKSTISADGKTVTWAQIGLGTEITTKLSHDKVKSTLRCNPNADLSQIKFTLRMAEDAYPQLMANGEIGLIFPDGEAGYMPTPISWDWAGNAIPTHYEILPRKYIVEGGVTLYSLWPIQMIVDVSAVPVGEDGKRLGDLFIDPSWSVNYGDISTLNVFNARAWNNFLTSYKGTGKSWSALGNFPDSLLIVGRVDIATHIQIFGTSSTPYAIFDNSINNMLQSSFDTSGPKYISMDEFRMGVAQYNAGSEGPVDVVDWNENIAGQSDTAATTQGYGTQGRSYVGGISARNTGAGLAQDDFYISSESNEPDRGKWMVKDSTGVAYQIGLSQVNAGRVTIRKMSDWSVSRTSGSVNTLNTFNAVCTFTEPAGGTNGLAALGTSGTALYLYSEAGWTAAGSTTIAHVVKITNLAAKSICAYGRYIYAVGNANGAQQMYVIDAGGIINNLMGDKTVANLQTTYLKIIRTNEQGGGDINLDLDDLWHATAGRQVWGQGRILAGEAYLLVPVTGNNSADTCGLFALDLSAPFTPTLNGKLITDSKTGIFNHADIAVFGTNATSRCQIVDGATNIGWRTISFYNPSTSTEKIVRYDIQLDTTAPTITGENPAPDATGVDGDTNVYFEIDDDMAGVDSETITVTVDGNAAITAGVFQSGYTGTIVAAGLGYNVTINPGSTMSGLIAVVINVSDLAGNAMTEYEYSFTCGDTTPPTVPAITYPTAGATNIPLSPTVTWSASTDDSPPIYYQLQIATDSGFSNIVFDSGWIAALSKVISPALSPLTTYYRRIRAKDSA